VNEKAVGANTFFALFKQKFTMVFKEIVDSGVKIGVDFSRMDTLPPQGGHHPAAVIPNNPRCHQRVRERRETLRRRGNLRWQRCLHQESKRPLSHS
jgi:hypothetical protein